MKYIKTFENYRSKNNITTFILDFGMFITMNLSKIQNDAIDSNAKNELTTMLAELRKPIINGKNYSEIINDNISNPKLLSGLFEQIRSLLNYIKPRIIKYVKDGEYKTKWMDKIKDFEKRYLEIIN